jgi:hypothetical protein
MVTKKPFAKKAQPKRGILLANSKPQKTKKKEKRKKKKLIANQLYTLQYGRFR